MLNSGMRERFVLLVTQTGSFDQSTVELGGRIAQSLRAVLVFLHVAPLDPADGEGMLQSAVSLLNGNSEGRLRGVRPTQPLTRFRHEFATGRVEDVVVDWVSRGGVELVVMEQPRTSRLQRILQDDVAQRLIQRLPCPVLVGGPETISRRPVTAASPPSGAHQTKLDVLRSLLDARVSALINWMDGAADAVGRVATSDAVAAVAWTRDLSSVMGRRLRTSLSVELNEHIGALGAVSWELRTPAGVTRPGGPRLAPSPGLERFIARVGQQGQATSPPLAADNDLVDLVVLAGAQVECAAGDGMLLFVFDARDHFLRILGQPAPYPTLETYAFDGAGTMLSNSLFTPHLHAVGLLDDGAEQTALRLRVAEPVEGPMDTWPLTQMARRAMEEGDGFDDRGYADYRGKKVIGAWRWIEPYGFGVTAEIDAG